MLLLVFVVSMYELKIQILIRLEETLTPGALEVHQLCKSYTIFENFQNFQNVSKIGEISKIFPKWKKFSNLLSFLSFRGIPLSPKYVLDVYLNFIFS